MDQKMLYALLTLALISPSYYFTDTADAFKAGTESNKSDWKTFKDRDGLFTIDYPSKWIPGYTSEADKSGPIDVYFIAPGSTDKNWAEIDLLQYDEKSAFNSANESLESEISNFQNDPTVTKFQIERPIECSKYTINGVQACSYIYEINSKDGGHSAILAVDALLNDGTEYESYYKADINSWKKYLPIAEEMLMTFKTTDNNSVTSGVLSDNETTTDLNTTNTTSSGDDDFSLN
jgi:hypothetical protein